MRFVAMLVLLTVPASADWQQKDLSPHETAQALAKRAILQTYMQWRENGEWTIHEPPHNWRPGKPLDAPALRPRLRLPDVAPDF
jgi:hypothetical protein